MHIKAQVCLNHIFLFYSFVYFFIALPLGSVCLFIFFYKFNCADSGLQLGDHHALMVCCCGPADILHKFIAWQPDCTLSDHCCRVQSRVDNVQALFQFLLARSHSTKLHSVRYTENKKLSRRSLPND